MGSLRTNVTKTRKFCFMGRLGRFGLNGANYYGTHRDWVRPFVEAHFGNDDYLLVTGEGSPEKLGPFDHSRDEDLSPDGYRQILAECQFVLAPGGDQPWSYRFAEAAFVGAIPIVDDPNVANAEVRFTSTLEPQHKIGW